MARHKGTKKAPVAKKPPLTHFLCIPLVTPTSRETLTGSLQKFADAVSLAYPSAGEDGRSEDESQEVKALRLVHPKAIRPVGALHLTLGVMSLKPDQLATAIQYLRDDDVRKLINATIHGSPAAPESASYIVASDGMPASEGSISPPSTERGGGPLELQLKGVESMHAPQKTSILYIAPTDDSGRLYPFCVALQKLFQEKGFLVEDNRPLKLHATIVNTIYAKQRKPPARRSNDPKASANTAALEGAHTDVHVANSSVGASRDHGIDAGSSSRTIDATAILDAYKSYIWVDKIVLDRIAICEMGAKKIFNETGMEIGAEYTEVATAPLSD